MAYGKGEASAESSRGARLAAPPVLWISAVQVVVLVLMSFLTLLFERAAALSLAAGGLCAVLPQAWFALQVFVHRGHPQQVARRGYAAVASKFMLTTTGFALVFALLRPLVAPAVFAGFIAMLLLHLGGAIWLLRRASPRPQAG